jgi:activating signal cointegrator 1
VKTLSLLQPWATLVVTGAKRIETRSWNTDYRGPLLIHASKKFLKADRLLCETDRYFAQALQDRRVAELPLGAIIGKVMLKELRTTTVMLASHELSEQEKRFGNYDYGRWAWLLTGAEEFVKPIPAKGSLGIWEFRETL